MGICSLSLFCHLMLEIQSFIAVDGLGKEKQMFHGHHFTPLSPELAMRHLPLYRQGNLFTRIESSHAGSPNLHGQSQHSDQICLSLKVRVDFFVCFVFWFTSFSTLTSEIQIFFFKNYTYSFYACLPKPFWLLNIRRNHMWLSDFRAAVLAAMP